MGTENEIQTQPQRVLARLSLFEATLHNYYRAKPVDPESANVYALEYERFTRIPVDKAAEIKQRLQRSSDS